MLHDIGKCYVPDEILKKPSALTPEEYAIVKQHPLKGAGMVRALRSVPEISDGVLYHHERYDGTRLSYGEKGTDIPLVGRIIAVADAYDAMSSDRVYRSKLSHAEILEELHRGSGTQFDPAVVEAFLQVLQREPGEYNAGARSCGRASMPVLKKQNRHNKKPCRPAGLFVFCAATNDILRALCTYCIGELCAKGERSAFFDMAWLIDMQHIDKWYDTAGGQSVHALEDVSLQVAAGEMLAILGRSGSGKSTLMNLLGCLDTPTRGEYRLAGQPVDRMNEAQLAAVRGKTVGFVFQSFCLLPQLTALENVELPLIYQGVPEKRRRRMAQECLSRWGWRRA